MLYDIKFKHIIKSFEKGFVKNKIEEGYIGIFFF